MKLGREYRETLNLPRTNFPMRANLKEREPEIERRWDEIGLYKLLADRKSEKLFVLHDGPPYSNESIHMGQGLNKVLKDIIIKYHILKGFKCPYIPGWDNHGMPIENEVIKRDPALQKLIREGNGLKNPDLRLTVRKKCREFAMHWIDVQRREFKRLGVLADWENPYITMSKEYEGQEILLFAELVERGYIYRGFMPIHWCPECRTALALSELEYKEKESYSLWFKMPLVDKDKSAIPEDTSAIVWTTTPWTIISNIALAFHPNIDYLVIKREGNRYLIARARLDDTVKLLGWNDIEIESQLRGAELEGSLFKHPFFDRNSRGILADFVSINEGTGIVHIAPGHGREDFEIGRKYGLEVLSPVDEQGIFTDEAGDIFKGSPYEEASLKVLDVLKDKGSLLKLEKLRHQYPHCWRCKNPLIFRATEQWFLSVDHLDLRERALKAIREVRWHPQESINRIYPAVKERPDWCISRQRAWGVNIPAFYCKECREVLLNPEIIRNIGKIFKEKGADIWYEKPVEYFIPEDIHCKKCSSNRFEKEMDILDVWIDSGSSNLIVLSEEEGTWPCDVYLEGPDQHRAWFNASLMMAMAIKGRAPYRTVITHGWALDKEGRTMHKSLGNVISPMSVVENYGADVFRLWIAQSDYTEDLNFSEENLYHTREAYKKIRNTFRFILGNLFDFNPERDYLRMEELFPVDRYILHRLELLMTKVEKYYESFEFHRVSKLLFNFIVVELSSFYLDILKDRLYTWKSDSRGRRSAQSVLYEALRALLVMYSPIIPHTTEEVWGSLTVKKEKSIFLTSWPEKMSEWRDPKLEAEFDTLLKIRDLVHIALEKARVEKKILSDRLEAYITLYPKNAETKEILEKHNDTLYELFIVSKVSLSDGRIESDVEYDSEDIWIGVARARGKKCERCWLWSEEITEDELCPKCSEVLGG